MDVQTVVVGERYNVKVEKDNFNDGLVGGTYIGETGGRSYFKLDNGKFAYWANRGSWKIRRIGANVSVGGYYHLVTNSLEKMARGHRRDAELLLKQSSGVVQHG